MTREEAIDIIKCLAWHTRPNEEDVEQAIKALQQEPCIPTRDLSDKELKHFAEEMKKVRVQVVEQEPILDKIRSEIKEKIGQEEFARSVFYHEEKDTAKAEQCTGSIMAYKNVIKLIDKYKAESEEEICR